LLWTREFRGDSRDRADRRAGSTTDADIGIILGPTLILHSLNHLFNWSK
jgi:hypothetical protein